MCKHQLSFLPLQVGDSPTPLFVTLTQRKQQNQARHTQDSDSEPGPSQADRTPSGSFPPLYPQLPGVAPHAGLAFFPGKSPKPLK